MTIAIHLLGKPYVERDGVQVPPPRGRKAWALLAFLASNDVAPSRERLATLLFADADDPLGAVRWNLAELRRLLGMASLFKGERAGLPEEGTTVDVRVIRSGSWEDAISLPALGGEFLEGLDFPSSPSFDAWLLNERRHLKAAAEAVLREATLAQLGAGKPDLAIDTAVRLVSLDPLNDEHQALLIRSYARAGDEASAARQLAACTELFRRELGIEPDPSVLDAMYVAAGSSTSAPTMGAAAARAQLEAGRAAVDAGALEAGLECLRRAIAEAHSCGDLPLKAEALFEMGSALVHSGRRLMKEEGAAALHEALSLAERTDNDSLAAASERELAWLEMLGARYERAQNWLKKAEELAVGDEAELGRIYSVLGMCLTDTARYPEAFEYLDRAVELSARAKDDKRVAFALSFIGRAHLLRGELQEARAALERSLQIVRSESWIGFQAMPESHMGEVMLAIADPHEAHDLLEHAFALACRLGDACYESVASRGLGLVHRARGANSSAIDQLRDARMRLMERPDYVWLEFYALEALCETAIEVGHPSASAWVDELTDVAGRGGMRELLARAYLHRSRLGDPSALETARLVATDIDNPALHELLDAAPTSGLLSRQSE